MQKTHTPRRATAQHKKTHKTLNKKRSPQTTQKRANSSTTAERTISEAFTAKNARAFRKFTHDKPVTGEVVKAAYDLIKFGPTAFNCSPLRVKVLDTPAAKEEFVPCLAPGNEGAVRDSPVTVIFAYDSNFKAHFDFLSPGYDTPKKYYGDAPAEVVEESAKLNAHLQAGYLMSALKVQGYDLGPASGFDPAKTDAAFFAQNDKSATWKSFMYVNVGHGDESALFPRAPRFEFDAVSI